MSEAELPREVAALLVSGEKVAWCGQPRPAAFIVRALPNLAYGVTWAVLGAFWYRGSGGIGKMSAFEGWWKLAPLFSLPFIVAGLSFFLAPIKLGARARRTWYLVTDRRVLRVELSPRAGEAPQVRVFGAEDLRALQFGAGGGLEEIVLSVRAAENPHLRPRLEDGFFGLRDGAAALEAIRRCGEPAEFGRN